MSRILAFGPRTLGAGSATLFEPPYAPVYQVIQDAANRDPSRSQSDSHLENACFAPREFWQHAIVNHNDRGAEVR